MLPYSTQVLRRSQVDEAQADNMTDLLARRAPAIQVNDIQGSPFQGDLTYRGYRASGLLGASQGLSVYLDGVRINEPFGDVVNWDLVPEFAVDSIALVTGANPAFGLNTLGGAISLTSASGRSAPGLRGQVSVGSFGRQRADLSYGHAGADTDAYVALSLFDEDGWRDYSSGTLGTLLAKVSQRTSAGEFTLNTLFGRSRLRGNGLVPLYTLDEEGGRTPDIGSSRREAVYTHPDLTRNELAQGSLAWRLAIDADTSADALVYVRNSRRTTFNGDEAADGPDEDEESARVPRMRALAFGDPNAAINRTATKQRSFGLAVALSGTRGVHQWQVGASLDRARVRYEQTEQEATFDDTRGTVALDEEPELSAAVRGTSTQIGVYGTDTWKIGERTHVTGTLRLNQARVGNTLTSVDDATGDVTERPAESFRYRSLNPALGITQGLGERFTLFANLARNTRVPTVIELGCADPDEPCRLPTGLQADPYLKQIRSTSLEAGLRFGSLRGSGGSVALYRTDNRDDILFRSTSVVGQLGFFENFDRTRHQGVDADVHGNAGPVAWSLGWSLLDATYQADGVLRVGQRNVEVRPGTRIAGLPRQMLKAGADWTLLPGLSVGADLQAYGRRGVAGNEDGLLEDGSSERVDVSLPGYALVNLRASWKPSGVKGLEVFARVTNAANRRTASYGALAETRFDAQGAYVGTESEALFVAPGAPRGFTLGLRWSL